MAKSVVSFKKTYEEKGIRKSHGNVFVKTTDADLSNTLWAVKELFGYMSLPEHYHAAHSRFGQDIFEGTNKLILGGLMHEGESLVLEKADPPSQKDYSNMGVRDIWVTAEPPLVQNRCEVHSLIWNGGKPYVIVREEMKHVLPKTHSLMIDCIQKLQSRRPIWADLKNHPNITILRSSS